MGMTFADAAELRGYSIAELVCDLLVEENLALGHIASPPDNYAAWQQVNRDCMELLSRPDYMVGSDAVTGDSVTGHAHPHPRVHGTFPRCFRLRRQHPTLTVEQLVQRMTSNPARRFGLRNRGSLEKGYLADIVVFDADRIMDTATYDQPVQYPVGIPSCWSMGRLPLTTSVAQESWRARLSAKQRSSFQRRWSFARSAYHPTT